MFCIAVRHVESLGAVSLPVFWPTPEEAEALVDDGWELFESEDGMEPGKPVDPKDIPERKPPVTVKE